MLGETAELAVNLSLSGNFNQGIATAQRNLAGFNAAVKQTNAGALQIGTGVGQIAKGLVRVAEIAGVAVVGGLIAATKVASSFTDQMRTIATLTGEGPLKGIETGIRDLAKNTGASLTDLTGAYYDLLSAGIAVKDGQHDLELAYKLSRGALSTTAEAVDFLTTAINAYGLTQEQATTTADQFAQAVADGKVKLSEISSTFSNVASVAKSAGIGLDEIAASYAYLTAQGVDAASVTTEMNRAIVELLKPSAALTDLQKQMGTNYAELAKNKGLVPALEQMRIDAEKAGVPFQDLFGRLEAYKFALQTTGPAFAGFEAEQQKIIGSTGEMNKQFGERNQGLSYQLGRLKANVLDAGISIGQGLAPAVGRLADKLAGFLQSHGKDFVKFGQDVGNALDSIPWSKVEAGVKTLTGALGAALGILKQVPGEVDAAVVGFLGLNKLSGGLIGKGVGNIIGGGIQLVMARGSSPANPLFVADVTGGGGIPGAGGKGVPGLVKAAIPLAIAAGAIELGVAISGINDPKHQQLDPNTGKYRTVRTDVTTLAAREAALRGPAGPSADTTSEARTIGAIAGQASASALINFRAGERASLSDAFGPAGSALVDAATALKGAGRVLSGNLTASAADIIKGIEGRSASKYGGTGLGAAAVDATFQRNLLRTSDKIQKSGETNAQKIADLKTLQQRLIDHGTAGDRRTADKIGGIISAIQHMKPPVVNTNIKVVSNVSIREYARVTKLSAAFGQTYRTSGGNLQY